MEMLPPSNRCAIAAQDFAAVKELSQVPPGTNCEKKAARSQQNHLQSYGIFPIMCQHSNILDITAPRERAAKKHLPARQERLREASTAPLEAAQRTTVAEGWTVSH